MSKQEQTQLNFGIEELKIVANLIAAGSQRGMFKPEELTTVGELYSKTIAILTSAGELETPEQEGDQDA